MLQEIKNSAFAKNVIVLFTGSLAAQIIPFLALPILQKYYFTPADFGLLVLFISFFELFSKVSTLKLEYGIVLQSRTRDAINLAAGALKIALVAASIAAVLMFFMHPMLGAYYDIQELSYYFMLLPIYIIISAFTDTANYWFNRKKKFSAIAYAKVVQTSSAESAKLLFGVLKFSFAGLLIGRILGFTMASFYYIFRFIKHERRALQLINSKDTKRLIVENKKFIYFTTPSVFIGSLHNLTYLNLFQYYYGEEIVGNIGVSMLYLGTGFGVISLSFSQVFYSKLADITNKQQMLQVYKRFAKNLTAVALLPIAFVYLIPESIVVSLLGDAWSELLGIARIMVLWLSVWFVSSSLSFIYIRLGRQKQMVLFDILHLVLTPLGFFVGRAFDEGLTGSLLGFSISQIIFYVLTISLAIRYIKKAKDLS